MTNLEDSINNFSDYQLEKRDITVFEPCFCITLFSSEMVTKDHAPEKLLTPYSIFIEDFGSQINRILYDGNQMHGVKVNNKNQTYPYEWLSKSRTRFKGKVFVRLYAGSNNKMERSLPRLDWQYENAEPEFNDPSCCQYRISLPLFWLAERGINGVEDYITRLTGEFPLSYGYAGFALSFNEGEVKTRKEWAVYLKQWLERHPGIMSPDPRIESVWVAKTDGIVGLGWITLLGTEFCNRMGGVDALQQKMAAIPDVQITPFMQGGALIRIGDTPV